MAINTTGKYSWKELDNEQLLKSLGLYSVDRTTGEKGYNLAAVMLLGKDDVIIHREFTSSYTAKFVIEKNKMYVENANRALSSGIITPDNLEPNPKNPIIAAFFRNIGYADQLGSGVRNLFKYTIQIK